MLILLLLLGLTPMINQGVQINAHDMRIDVVRTDQQAANEHHPILDDPQYARVRPYTVTVRSNEGKAITIITILFDVVDEQGNKREIGGAMYSNFGKPVIERGKSCQFWPGGRMPTNLAPGRHPLMRTLPPDAMDVLEKAKSVTVSVDYVMFEDGTTAGPNTIDTPGKLARSAALRKQRGHISPDF